MFKVFRKKGKVLLAENNAKNSRFREESDRRADTRRRPLTSNMSNASILGIFLTFYEDDILPSPLRRFIFSIIY